jgi:hypothetical protein
MPPDQMSEMPDDELAQLTRRYWPLIDRARREENEACAKVAEKEASPEMMLERFTDDFAGGVIGASNAIAAAIRARVKERK